MSISITPKDYRSLSPEDFKSWVEAGSELNHTRSKLNSHWGPHTADEKLLAAIVADCFPDPADQFCVIFGKSKHELVSYNPRFGWITISRYAMADWDLAFDAAMQLIAEILTGQERGDAKWLQAVKDLGATPKEGELVFRDVPGTSGSMVTPYGPLDYIVGKTQLYTSDRMGGLVIAANRELLTLEAPDGSIHRFRPERLHPDSGNLDRVIRRLQTLRGKTIYFGESYVDQAGKRYYAVEWISPYRIMALAKDGSRLTPKATEIIPALGSTKSAGGNP